MTLDTFTRSYLETALGSSNDESTPEGGEPFDENYSIADIALESIKQAVIDCERFQTENADILVEGGSSRWGHDFWLTRNGHGAGFWDGDYPIHGNALTKSCEAFKGVNMTLGDDGQIYIE